MLSSERIVNFRNFGLLFIFVWMLGNFFPGSYGVDTWHQYSEAATNNFDDWHSPFYGKLWRLLLIFTDRFFSMYMFQMAWYFLFYYFSTICHEGRSPCIMFWVCYSDAH